MVKASARSRTPPPNAGAAEADLEAQRALQQQGGGSGSGGQDGKKESEEELERGLRGAVVSDDETLRPTQLTQVSSQATAPYTQAGQQRQLGPRLPGTPDGGELHMQLGEEDRKRRIGEQRSPTREAAAAAAEAAGEAARQAAASARVAAAAVQAAQTGAAAAGGAREGGRAKPDVEVRLRQVEETAGWCQQALVQQQLDEAGRSCRISAPPGLDRAKVEKLILSWAVRCGLTVTTIKSVVSAQGQMALVTFVSSAERSRAMAFVAEGTLVMAGVAARAFRSVPSFRRAGDVPIKESATILREMGVDPLVFFWGEKVIAEEGQHGLEPLLQLVWHNNISATIQIVPNLFVGFAPKFEERWKQQSQEFDDPMEGSATAAAGQQREKYNMCKCVAIQVKPMDARTYKDLTEMLLEKGANMWGSSGDAGSFMKGKGKGKGKYKGAQKGKGEFKGAARTPAAATTAAAPAWKAGGAAGSGQGGLAGQRARAQASAQPQTQHQHQTQVPEHWTTLDLEGRPFELEEEDEEEEEEELLAAPSVQPGPKRMADVSSASAVRQAKAALAAAARAQGQPASLGSFGVADADQGWRTVQRRVRGRAGRGAGPGQQRWADEPDLEDEGEEEVYYQGGVNGKGGMGAKGGFKWGGKGGMSGKGGMGRAAARQSMAFAGPPTLFATRGRGRGAAAQRRLYAPPWW